MSKRAVVFLGSPVLWVLLVLFGSAQVRSADEEHKGFLERINAYVRRLVDSLDKITPSQVSQDFYYRLQWCNFGWDFACKPIPESGAALPGLSRDHTPSGPRNLIFTRFGPLPIPNLETIRGIPSAIWYTLGNVFSASWLAKLVFALGLFLAVVVLIGAKESESFWPIALCIVFFPALVSLCAWLFILILKVVLYVTTGIVFLLILAFGILSWVMWIKDVWEARHTILKGFGKQPQTAVAEGTKRKG